MTDLSRRTCSHAAWILCATLSLMGCNDAPASPGEEMVRATVRANVEATFRVNGTLAVPTQTTGPAEITFTGPTAEVEADRCGYTPQTRTATADDELTFDLEPDPAFPWKLTIRTTPPDAEVTVDGEVVTGGEITLRGIDAPVRVVATHEGHRTVEQTFTHDDFECVSSQGGSLEPTLTLEPSGE